MKNTRTDQNHQDLVEDNTPALIQRFNPVEKIDHLSPIEIWNGSKSISAKGVLDE